MTLGARLDCWMAVALVARMVGELVVGVWGSLSGAVGCGGRLD